MTTALHAVKSDTLDIWAALAAPLNPTDLQWRQDGRPKAREGKFFARFVVYVEAGTVRERLDSVVPGEWDLTLELLPPLVAVGGEGEANETPCSFKARLQVLGVIREDVGVGKDYKQASTDAFKRCAVRFGIGHELYEYEQNWVQVDGDGKYAKPMEDPSVAYARRHGGAQSTSGANGAGVKSAENDRRSQGDAVPRAVTDSTNASASQQGAPASAPAADDLACPKCGGRMWDNRLTKRNPKAPDYKCRDRSCDGVIWPPKDEQGASTRKDATMAEADEIPFD
jgi:hypothetical protein